MVWLRRGAWIVGALVLAVLALWLGLPPLVKWQAETRLGTLLDRPVSVGAVHFVPWRLELTVDRLRVGAPAKPLLEVARLRADLAFGSIWHLRPIVDALEIEAPRLNVARTAPGHYDIDDLIEKFKPRPEAKPSEPARFSLYNFKLDNGTVRFDDRPAGRVHQLEALNLALPFLSNLPADVDVVVKPRLSFKLNGAAFDSGAQATPFASTDKGDLHLSFSALDFQPYLAYWPATLPLHLTRGTLAADLTLGFVVPAASGRPQVALHGRFDARDIALADRAGAPQLAWRELKLGLRDVQPLARKLAFASLRIDGLQAHLARDAQGRLVL
ncbi:MAG: DUF748 domain-containing protein, partial [Burkholderiales bacterium]|nr:DUF748 domain-containing protein [Burkholderiales bacterium]